MPDVHRDLLRTRRISLNLSTTQVAHRCGISRQHLANIEAGQRSPSVELVSRLARALGFDPGDLLVGIAVSHGPISDRRVALGIPAVTLAAAAGLSYSHLLNLEAGRKRPSPEALTRLARALHCTTADLTGLVPADSLHPGDRITIYLAGRDQPDTAVIRAIAIGPDDVVVDCEPSSLAGQIISVPYRTGVLAQRALSPALVA